MVQVSDLVSRGRSGEKLRHRTINGVVGELVMERIQVVVREESSRMTREEGSKSRRSNMAGDRCV